MIDLTLTPQDYEGFYIARDDDNKRLVIYSGVPCKNGYGGYFTCPAYVAWSWIVEDNSGVFSDVTFDNSPQPVSAEWLMQAGYDRDVKLAKLYASAEWRESNCLLDFFAKHCKH